MDLWPSFENIKEIKTPKQILEEQARFLRKKTNDMLYMEIFDVPSTTRQGKKHDFGLKYAVASKYVDNYRFNFFDIYYNLTIYPITVFLNKPIADTLKEQWEFDVLQNIKINDEKEFYSLLKDVFNNEFVLNIVSTLISMSR
jgi:hypothetical protein